jgi:photosystem II stability/assembly factor-like uncharacterized protein
VILHASRGILALAASCTLFSDAGLSQAHTSDRNLFHLSSIHMVDSGHGWGMAGSTVYRTSDGGSNWTNVMPRSVARGAQTAAVFRTISQAWLAVAPAAGSGSITVYRTSNGGASWQGAALSEQGGVQPGQRLSFADARRGWLLVNKGVGAGSNPYALLRTSDGGAHWTVVVRSLFASPKTPSQLPSCDCTTAITFRDASTGWATGRVFRTTEAEWLYVTRDGGRTWRLQVLRMSRRFPVSETFAPMFFGHGIGVLPVRLIDPRAANTFEVFRTGDGGRTWLPTSLVHLGPGQISYSFASSGQGWVTTGYRLFHTVNGGHSWSAAAPVTPLRNSPDRSGMLQFLTANSGFALGPTDPNPPSGILYATVDGGHSWRQIATYDLRVK